MNLKTWILIILFSSTISVFGQNISLNDSVGYKGYMLVMGKENHRIDTLTLNKLDPSWIKKIKILKSPEQKNLYGNKIGITLIYPKKRFYQRIKALLNKESLKVENE